MSSHPGATKNILDILTALGNVNLLSGMYFFTALEMLTSYLSATKNIPGFFTALEMLTS